MKNIIIVLALVFALPISAQRKVETFVAINKNQDIYLHFKFAQNIKVEQWNKNEVSIKAEVYIDNGRGNEAFSLVTDTSGSTLEVSSDFGNYFRDKWKNKNRYHEDSRTEITYIIYVPENFDLKIKSISGSVESDSFKGNLRTDLVSGNVTIKDYNGKLSLKTVSGDLDVTMKKAEVNAKTLTGTIYSNLEIDMENKKRKGYGYNKIIGTVNSGGELVKMETVSGDIYLRKS